MGKAYSETQRAQAKTLLEAGRDEESIEKETGVSDRTIRRWKLELERTGRIGKPPESRTGRHRVLNPEVEAALFEHVKLHPEMSVDDMLWWLYDQYKIVVGTRTVRRVFERKDKVNPTTKGKAKGRSAGRKSKSKSDLQDDDDDDDDEHEEEGNEDDENQPDTSTMDMSDMYQSPYVPLAQSAEQQLAQAFQQTHPTTYPPLPDTEADLPEDEETLQLQLQQIALQKREVELKLQMRRLKNGKGTPNGRKIATLTPQSAPSSLYNPTAAAAPTPPKRDSRSKKKIEESKKRTAERQERMLRDLERRSRRRDHLTAEWVQSKDIWPLRAQGMLADLMHQYATYSISQSNIETFEAMYRDLYQLVDLSTAEWDPQVHDEMLRERMKRKMGQLRTKMQKSGEIVGRNDSYGGWQKADNYTGEAAGAAVGDEPEMSDPMQPHPGAPQMSEPDQLQYDPVADHQAMQHANMQYGMTHQMPSQYPMIPHQSHQTMPYGPMDANQGMVM
nr:hypothetical protein CFP56_66159 [Quercus suber]